MLDNTALKLAVAVPWTSEFGWTRSWKSIARLGFFKHPENCEMELFGGPELGDGWCSARRHNACLEQAVLWGADLSRMLGADQKYQPDMICKLVQRYRDGCEVVAANVPIRGHVANQGTKPFQPICWRVKPDENGNIILKEHIRRSEIEFVGPEYGDIVQINGCGSGVLMFPADSLKDIKAPWFFEEPMPPTFTRKACADWPFVSRLQKEAGLKIWCDTTIKVTHIHPFEIDDSFTERFADWEEGVGDPNCCEPEDDTKGTIKQARVSPSIPFFDEKFRTRYRLDPYQTPFLPAIFFGCYTKEDFKAIQEHRGDCVVVWAGTDALLMRTHVKTRENAAKLFPPHIKHVAISRFIADDLDALGISYTRIPLCCVNKDLFQPTPATGKGIYAYVPKNDREKYGGPFIDALKARMPDCEWFINDGLRYQPEDMPKIYKRCMVGIRATQHDGLSNTVVEMGLMGRRVLWNGDAPNAIPFDTLDDAEAAIRKELDAPTDRPSVANEVANWIDIGEHWKNVGFYQSKPMQILTPEIASQPYSYHRYFDFRYDQGVLGAGGPQPAGAEAQFTREYVMKTLRDTESESIVEIGCGSMVRWGNPCSENYIGIDVSEKAIQQARERFPNHSFIRRDVTVEDIPTADAIVCIDMFQHIKHDDVLPLLKKMLAAATKAVIIKTSVNIPENYYQFNHDWESFKIEVGEPSLETTVPGVPHAKFFVFTKVLPFSAGEDRGRGLAAASVPGASLTEQEPAAC